MFVPLPLPLAAPEAPAAGDKAVGDELTVTPNAEVGGTERTVPLPELSVTAAVPVLLPDPDTEPDAEADAEVDGAMVDEEDASGPMEKGEETANSLLMLPTSVARRV